MVGIKGRSGVYEHKPHSEETKRKIRKALEGQKRPSFSEKWCENIGKAQKGKKLSRKLRERLSEIKKGKMPKNCTEEWRKKGRLAMLKSWDKRKPTSIEKKVYEELKKRGLLFEKQKLINGKFLVDAYIPSLNLIVEADGDYWHSLPKIKNKDKAENAYLRKCGFGLLRLTETEINNGGFKNKLKAFALLDAKITTTHPDAEEGEVE